MDTHLLLWAVSDDPRLSKRQRQILHQGDALVVSAVSIWEIAKKRALGKPVLNGDIVDAVKSRNIPFLAINERHAARTEHLGDHHRDPFDRLLIAQAQVESLTILTSDTIFRRYDVMVV
ncbi:type II toxin-antitoxin system VapC family toxin [Phyllobacterium endophyticum]|uniref:PIN domain nuclease n=1 Tax=Phyllobacterium endophyticum TaxID=1149773 RepID=A0A2P7ARM0_9HYPH|nr:type II toxin-antitoxin system VapC family toxin [Phyllobacterium endophyticum]PSH56872.1 PIN domain nuclease [Phyllobacterium endophyticum]TYR39547.1 type II toxin-antitoxin system VapC family toxin [Phyllobacterium endophyticum]